MQIFLTIKAGEITAIVWTLSITQSGKCHLITTISLLSRVSYRKPLGKPSNLMEEVNLSPSCVPVVVFISRNVNPVLHQTLCIFRF